MDEGDKLYQSAYGILLSQRVAASQIDISRVQSDFESAVHEEDSSILFAGKFNSGRKTGDRREARMEEIEDESVIEARAKEKSRTHILIHENEFHEDEEPQPLKHPSSPGIRDHQASCVEVEDEFWAEHRA